MELPLPGWTETLAAALFALAVLHTFSVKRFQHWARRYPEGSVAENFFHLLGEVEIVFGLWAMILALSVALMVSPKSAIQFIESADFTEPAFVFAIMTIAATRPVLDFARLGMSAVSKLIPLPSEAAFLLSALTLGPLLGSFITEPAAMTVTALVLKDRYFDRGLSQRFMYLAIGTLFVNVSIGGVLTPYAAPPVLMVAKTWNWDLAFMLQHFGWKSAIAVVINTAILIGLGFPELKALRPAAPTAKSRGLTPFWLQLIHLLFLALVVLTAHHPTVFLGFLLFFLGLTQITQEYQDDLKLRDALLVAFFLGGLVVLGSLQRWWLAPIVQSLDPFPLFLGATTLTAFTDNAALTYLGAQVPGVTPDFQYALVAGAIAGGGLTVIANAPNPAGFAILRESFGSEGISPLRLFLGALVPTLVAMTCLWIFP